MPVKILHAADLHIDSPLRGLSSYPGAPAEEIRSATRQATENLVSFALQVPVDLVVLAGDIFDGTWRDFNTGLFLVHQLQLLHDAGIPVVMVHGNHDAESLITNRLRLPPSCTALPADAPASAVFDDIGVAVHGQSYAQRAVTADLAAGYPAPVPGLFNLGLLHTSLDGRSEHDPYAPSSLTTLRRRGYDYWALGHVHEREVVSEEPWVVFPGNLQGRHMRECGPKGATLVEVHADGGAKAEAVTLDVLRWEVVQVDASGAEGFDDILDRVESAIDRAESASGGRLLAARVRLSGETPADGWLRSHADHAAAEIRSVASRFARVWVERAQIDTATPLSRRPVATGVASAALALRNDPDALRALVGDLVNKLPPDLREAADLRLLDPAWLASLTTEAEALLQARLSEVLG